MASSTWFYEAMREEGKRRRRAAAKSILAKLRQIARENLPCPDNKTLGNIVGFGPTFASERLRELRKQKKIRLQIGFGTRRIFVADISAWTDWATVQITKEPPRPKPPRPEPPPEDRLAQAMRGRRFEDHPNAAPPGPLLKLTPGHHRRSLVGCGAALCAL